MSHLILADTCVGVSELKKNPMAAVESGDGAPVAILNRNEPAFYAIPAAAYEAIVDRLEDVELASLIKSRKSQASVEVSLNDL